MSTLRAGIEALEVVLPQPASPDLLVRMRVVSARRDAPARDHERDPIGCTDFARRVTWRIPGETVRAMTKRAADAQLRLHPASVPVQLLIY